jgi:hypothetical protein
MIQHGFAQFKGLSAYGAPESLLFQNLGFDCFNLALLEVFQGLGHV